MLLHFKSACSPYGICASSYKFHSKFSGQLSQVWLRQVVKLLSSVLLSLRDHSIRRQHQACTSAAKKALRIAIKGVCLFGIFGTLSCRADVMTKSNRAQGQTIMQANDSLYPPRLVAFKKKIGFDQAVENEKSQYVDINWATLKLPAELAAWKIIEDEIVNREDSTIYTRKLQNEKKLITVVAHVYKPNKKKEASEIYLMDINNTTMVDIFYIPSPVQIGTSSVVDKSQPPSKGLFLFLNTPTQIFSSGTDDSLFTFAKWLQNEYGKNLKPMKSLAGFAP